jgi:hypothetical protein
MSAIKVHDFAECLRAGQRGEHDLDFFFARWHKITLATAAEQRDEIDRHFVDERGKHLAVEYKTDARADETGRIFVETVSVDTTRAPGGHIRSRADYIAIYLPKSELVYWMQVRRLRERVKRWHGQYPYAFAQNRTYKTWGLLVPQWEFERSSNLVLNMADYKHWRARRRQT